jgi:hypothetical protein
VLANKPTVVLTAAGRLGASFDGVDDFLKTAAFAAVAQPTTIYVVEQRTAGVAIARHVYDGFDFAGRHALFHLNATGFLGIYANAGLVSATASLTMDVVTAQFDGATSRIWRNGTLIAGPGNAGPHGVAGVTLGARYDGVDPFGGYIMAYLGYPGVHSDAQRNAIIAALTAEAGI